jgi:hypothetical protein
MQGLRDQEARAGGLERHLESDELAERRVEVQLRRRVGGGCKGVAVEAFAVRDHDPATEGAAQTGELAPPPSSNLDLAQGHFGLAEQL